MEFVGRMKLEKSLSETRLNSVEGFPIGGTCSGGLPRGCLPGEPKGFLEGAFFSHNPLGFTVWAVGSDSVIFNTSREGR